MATSVSKTPLVRAESRGLDQCPDILERKRGERTEMGDRTRGEKMDCRNQHRLNRNEEASG